MEKYERKIRIQKELTAIDTDGDGVDDTLVFINNKNLYVPFLLKQSIKDIGVYTDYQEKVKEVVDVIDLSSFWNTSNDGTGDGGEILIGTDFVNPYEDDGDGETIIITNEATSFGCNDPEALNYDSNIVYNVNANCIYATDEITPTGGPNTSSGLTSESDATGCYNLSSGCIEEQSLTQYLINEFKNTASNWCAGSCGTNPSIADCDSNGCGGSGSVCCPSSGGWELPAASFGNFCDQSPTPCIAEDVNYPKPEYCCSPPDIIGIPIGVFNVTKAQCTDTYQVGNTTYNKMSYSYRFWCVPIL